MGNLYDMIPKILGHNSEYLYPVEKAFLNGAEHFFFRWVPWIGGALEASETLAKCHLGAAGFAIAGFQLLTMALIPLLALIPIFWIGLLLELVVSVILSYLVALLSR